jgi:hypothetical protein
MMLLSPLFHTATIHRGGLDARPITLAYPSMFKPAEFVF